MKCWNKCVKKSIYSPVFKKYFCGGCGSELKEEYDNESRN